MPFPPSAPTITYIHRPRYVLAAGPEGGPFHKLFQLRLRGGAHPWPVVDFTYAPFGSGIASRFLYTKESKETYNWFDPDASMQTSHRPKYSHHEDGRAHFSQDGKIITSVRRHACPLRDINGHAFTLHIQGVPSFPPMNAKDETALQQGKRSYISLIAGGALSDMISLVGSVFTRDAYSHWNQRRGVRGVKKDDILTKYIYPTGDEETVAILTCPNERLAKPTSLLVELRLSRRQPVSTTGNTMLFIGGFDSRNWKRAQDVPGFLAMRFPAAPEPRDLSLLQSMDLPPRPRPLQD